LVCEYERRKEESEVEHYVRLIKLFDEKPISYDERQAIMKRVFPTKSELDPETSFDMNQY
jgi:hypothetical protein